MDCCPNVRGASKGFTLVELAVVVTIIALLMLLVFRGESLIGTGQSQQVLAAVKDLGAAVGQFRARYNYLPGDMPDAVARIPGVAICKVPAVALPAGGNGDGNGQVDAGEIACVPEHLFRAGMIRSNGAITLTTKKGTISIRVIARTSSALVGSFPSSTRNLIEVLNVPCQIAQDLDAKTDDGNFSSGNTRASVANCTVDGANDPVPVIGLGL
jgi:prepilin-type N-terminal cleavage/methylation domain-containing protein